MFKKKNRKKTSRAMLSAYSIIMILIVLLGILSHVLPKAKYHEAPVEDETVQVEEETAPQLEATVGAEGQLITNNDSVTPLDAGTETTLDGAEAATTTEEETTEPETSEAKNAESENLTEDSFAENNNPPAEYKNSTDENSANEIIIQ